MVEHQRLPTFYCIFSNHKISFQNILIMLSQILQLLEKSAQVNDFGKKNLHVLRNMEASKLDYDVISLL